MSEEIIKVLDYIGAKLGIAIDWSSENVWPQVLNILGRYKVFAILTNAIDIIFALAIMAAAVVLLIKSIQGYSAHGKMWCTQYSWGYEANVLSILVWICSTFAVIVCLAALFTAVQNLLQWIIVPEVQYVEMLKSYIQ